MYQISLWLLLTYFGIKLYDIIYFMEKYEISMKSNNILSILYYLIVYPDCLWFLII